MCKQHETFQVLSSWGQITASRVSGEIISFNLTCEDDGESRGLEDISRFDIDEWKRTYPTEEVASHIDKLDLGYWMNDGSYCSPEFSWRKQFNESRNVFL
jgi:hypothetical protein